jgi:hypothetical protein
MLMQTVLVHFDVSNDHIFLETFISSAKAAQSAVNALSVAYFDGRLEFDLIVVPPKSGTFKQYIGIAVKIVGYSYVAVWSAIQLMDSETVQRISRELTGKTPTDYLIEVVADTDEGEALASIDSDTEVDDSDLDAVTRIEELVSESVRAALEKTRDEISDMNIPSDLKFELENAQSDLFGAALEDPEVKGIGFGEEDEFPIQRNQFAQRAVRPVPPRKEEDDEDWQVGVMQIRVTSPNFERADQAARKWKGKTSEASTILFEIEDEEFWQKLHKGEFEFAESTIIEAQVATLFVGGKPRLHRAIRVMKVDSTRIGIELDENAITAIVGKFKSKQPKDTGPDLLSFL